MRRLLLFLFACTTPAFAQSYTGIPTVTDGDTLAFRGLKFRLHGVDAPESAQLCVKGGQAYQCGRESANALADKTHNKTVVCEQRDKDRYGRIVAVCKLSTTGEDLNRWLVQNGYAVAYVEYSRDYVADEAKAKSAKKGIWAGSFQMPWEYRRNPSNPSTAGTAPKPGATTTGDVSFRNCTEARNAGYSNMRRGEPGYAPKHDRDNDGVACER